MAFDPNKKSDHFITIEGPGPHMASAPQPPRKPVVEEPTADDPPLVIGGITFPREASARIHAMSADERVTWDADRFRARTDPIYLSGVLGMDLQEDPHRVLFENLLTLRGPDFPLAELDPIHKKMVLWPRGVAKTSSARVVMVQIILNYPNARLCFLTGGDLLAKRQLLALKLCFERPTERFQYLFPEFCLKSVFNKKTHQWSDFNPVMGTTQQFSVPARSTTVYAEPTFAISTPKSVKSGAHFDFLFIDDIVNDQNYANGAALEKCYQQYLTNYLYNGANVAQEISGGSPIANMLSGGVDEVFTRTDSSGTANFFTDALGSTLELTDGSGSTLASYAYEPFGNTTVTSGSSTNEFQYTGRENDGTGVYFNRGRYYNPTLQRFISEDPIGFSGGINFYAYAGNNPVDFTDPFGLDKGPSGGCDIKIRGTDIHCHDPAPPPTIPPSQPCYGGDAMCDPSGRVVRSTGNAQEDSGPAIAVVTTVVGGPAIRAAAEAAAAAATAAYDMAESAVNPDAVTGLVKGLAGSGEAPVEPAAFTGWVVGRIIRNVAQNIR